MKKEPRLVTGLKSSSATLGARRQSGKNVICRRQRAVKTWRPTRPTQRRADPNAASVAIVPGSDLALDNRKHLTHGRVGKRLKGKTWKM
jgi:hypothetical protein